MTSSLIQFLISSGIIVLAGAALTQFADAISYKTKLGGMFIGSLLLAGATSLPEFFIDVSAVRIGSFDLAVGDLLGSSLFNLLILAVLDMTRFSHGRMLSHKSAAHALPAGVSIVLTTIAALFIFLGPKFKIMSVWRISTGSILIMAAYVIGARLIFSGQKEAADSLSKEQPAYWIPGIKKLGLKGTIAGYIASASAIVAAAPFLAKAAKDLAEQTGLGSTFFGTTFVALCTSLPEMVTTFSAVRIKAFDLALGNIFGSNCFNMALIFPLDFFHAQSLLSSVSQIHVFSALCVVLATTVVILGQLYQVEKKKHFLEPDALIVIFLIFGALFGVYHLR